MQPKKEVFELHNTRLQEKLTQSVSRAIYYQAFGARRR
jgi:hypothetical protein